MQAGGTQRDASTEVGRELADEFMGKARLFESQ